MGNLLSNYGQNLLKNLINSLISAFHPKSLKANHLFPGSQERSRNLSTKRISFSKAHGKTGDPQLRGKYVSLRHLIRKKTKESHEAYLEDMIGLVSQENTATGRADNKKLLQYLKNSRTDQQGIPPLSQNGLLHSDTTEKAGIFNQQFQSVFTPLSPLSLRDLSIMKVQDLVDDKVLPQSAIPKDLRNPTPVMPDINISEQGFLQPVATGNSYSPGCRWWCL